MRIIRSLRQTPALAISILALIIAMSGTSVAAMALAKGQVKTKHLAHASVTGKKIKNGAVNHRKLKNNSVTSRAVKDGSLLADDFRAGELPAGPQGPSGAPGVPGARGVPGPQGVPGAPALVGALTQSVATPLEPLSCYSLRTGGAGRVDARGAIISGYLDNGAGAAVAPNYVVVIPGARNLTTQGGTVGGVLICNLTTSVVRLPAGWEFNKVEYDVP